MIQIDECPSCGRATAALTLIDDGDGYCFLRCPACAPTPDKTPHDYRPVSAPKATGGVVKLTDEQARELSEPPGYVVFDEAHAFTEDEWTAIKSASMVRIPAETLKAYDDAMKVTDEATRKGALAAMAIRNNVCCLDPGDCNGPCELV